MFGFFNALTRLTNAITRSANLFEQANEKLAERLSCEDDSPAETNGNGRLPHATTESGRTAFLERKTAKAK